MADIAVPRRTVVLITSDPSHVVRLVSVLAELSFT